MTKCNVVVSFLGIVYVAQDRNLIVSFFEVVYVLYDFTRIVGVIRLYFFLKTAILSSVFSELYICCSMNRKGSNGDIVDILREAGDTGITILLAIPAINLWRVHLFVSHIG
jgi:hypothetical protein